MDVLEDDEGGGRGEEEEGGGGIRGGGGGEAHADEEKRREVREREREGSSLVKGLLNYSRSLQGKEPYSTLAHDARTEIFLFEIDIIFFYYYYYIYLIFSLFFFLC